MKMFHSVRTNPVRCDSFQEGHFYKFIPFFSKSLGLGRIWVRVVNGKRKYFYQDFMGRVTPWKMWETTRFKEVAK